MANLAAHRTAPGVLLSLALVLLFSESTGAIAQDTAATNTRIESLIDGLTQIDAPAAGIDPNHTIVGFVLSEDPFEFVMGVWGAPKPIIPSQMRELVQLGVVALPSLIAHLDDRRTTRFAIKADDPMQTFGGTYFGSEYVPRHGTDYIMANTDRPVRQGYTVKVGDICYVIIGQIVNRNLLAVRYQPSDLIFINSPLESPELIDRVKRDWENLDVEHHKAQLLVDLRASADLSNFAPALARLRFYYPMVYGSLVGTDLKKRAEFEAFEASRKKRDYR